MKFFLRLLVATMLLSGMTFRAFGEDPQSEAEPDFRELLDALTQEQKDILEMPDTPAQQEGDLEEMSDILKLTDEEKRALGMIDEVSTPSAQRSVPELTDEEKKIQELINSLRMTEEPAPPPPPVPPVAVQEIPPALPSPSPSQEKSVTSELPISPAPAGGEQVVPELPAPPVFPVVDTAPPEPPIAVAPAVDDVVVPEPPVAVAPAVPEKQIPELLSSPAPDGGETMISESPVALPPATVEQVAPESSAGLMPVGENVTTEMPAGLPPIGEQVAPQLPTSVITEAEPTAALPVATTPVPGPKATPDFTDEEKEIQRIIEALAPSGSGAASVPAAIAPTGLQQIAPSAPAFLTPAEEKNIQELLGGFTPASPEKKPASVPATSPAPAKEQKKKLPAVLVRAVVNPLITEPHYVNWKQTHRKLKDLFSRLKGNEEDIQAMFVKCNKAKGDGKKAQIESLFTKYPGLGLFRNYPFDEVNPVFDSRGIFIVSSSTIRHAINQRITLFEQLSPEKCLLVSSDTAQISLAPQTKIVAAICEKSYLNSKEPRKLYVRELTENVEMAEKVFETAQEFWQEMNWDGTGEESAPSVREATILWYENVFNGGAAISSLGVTFGSNTFTNYSAPSWVGPWKPSYREEGPRALCFDSMPSKEQEDRLYKLAAEYSNQKPFRLWKASLELKKRICSYMVNGRCGKTHSVKGTRIYSYQTVGCQVRHVTESDVKDDLESMESKTLKAHHSSIIDTLKFCDDAERVGYSWNYNKPALSENCAEMKGKKVKKKKKK